MKPDQKILIICIAVNMAVVALPYSQVGVMFHRQGPMDAFKAADAVFAGYALAVCTRLDDHAEYGINHSSTQTWTFRVFAIWKGRVGEHADIVFLDSDPELYHWGRFQLGKPYLIYATLIGGTLTMQARTKEFSTALLDRYLLSKPSKVIVESEFSEVSLDSLIYTALEGPFDPEWIADFRWLRKDADKLVPVMTSVLRSERVGDTQIAATVLGYMGPASRVAILDLERLATVPSERLRESAVRALDSIESDQTARLRRLVEVLHDPSPRLRLVVAELLYDLLAEIKLDDETNALISRLQVIGESDPDTRVREKIELALEKVDAKR